LGDIDCDGILDLAVGANTDNDGGSNRGAVWILSLNPDATVKAYQKISDTNGMFQGVLDDDDAFGTSAAAIGDMDGDGVAEIAVGALNDDDGGSARGAVWLLHIEGCDPLPVALQAYGATWHGTHVEVAWTLLGEPAAALTFDVTRAALPGGQPVRIDQPAVEHDRDHYRLRDAGAARGARLRYHVVISEGTEVTASFQTEITTPPIPLSLGQNEPNPFNPVTRIPFSIDDGAPVLLEVYDISGRLVRRLVDRPMPPGSYSADWDGRDSNGNEVVSGMYFYRLQAGKATLTRKAVLLR
jgi:hypothetical protein